MKPPLRIASPALFMLPLLALLVLAGCGEKDQSIVASGHKTDGKPWQGAQDPYVAGGWTPGDKARWETQLRTRAQSQNEYNRVD